MPFNEMVLFGIGSAVSKLAFRIWLRDSPFAKDMATSVLDIIEKVVPGFFPRRNLVNQLEQLTDEISKRIGAFLEREGSSLPQPEIDAVELALCNCISNTNIDTNFLFSNDLDPIRLEKHIENNATVNIALLTAKGRVVFDSALREICNYIVEISVTMPSFALKSTQEFIQKENEIIRLVREVLDRLPKTQSYDNDSGGRDQRFEDQYRRTVARKLDVLELFGVDLSPANKRYALSVGYLSLSAACEAANFHDTDDLHAEVSSAIIEKSKGAAHRASGEEVIIRVEDALRQSRRLLIRGLAGSGKTTLLQWLAVRAANRDFDGGLTAWNDLTPFFLQLRRFVSSGLPLPEHFPVYIAAPILGEMPECWVHRQLRSGRALVLIDGVDELPEGKRKDVLSWLSDLVAEFPDSTYVVTSRPPAVGRDWLDQLGFSHAELQPMEPRDILSFIDHWHRAACTGITNDEFVADIERMRLKLRGIVRDIRSIRHLATSPLLCAMLCALNRERRSQLPNDRLELYRIAMEMLLERRDTEREVARDISTPPTLIEKQLLLRDLAYWMLSNNYSDIGVDDAINRFERKLAMMPRLRVRAKKLFEFMLERSGLLRSPVEGRIDFVHRTFQEYLAAKEAVEEDDIGVLLGRAHLDSWRETIILAAGHARKAQRISLIRGLLDRGSKEIMRRHVLHLTAVACLETSPELPPELVEELRSALRKLIPPKNKTDARLLASAGDLAVPLLGGHHRQGTAVATACIRALALIGSDAALEKIMEYRADNRVTVARELMRSWTSFDVERFARDVLSDCVLNYGSISLSDKALVPYVKYLKLLRFLYLDLSNQLDDVAILREAKNVYVLDISGCRVSDITELADHANIVNLHLRNCSSIQSFLPITKLPLTRLDLSGCVQITDASWLSSLVKLKYLDMSGCSGVDDFSFLSDLKSLGMLYLRQTKVKALPKPPESLKVIDLSGCENIFDVTWLNGANLSRLSLDGASAKCIQSVDLAEVSISNFSINGIKGLTALPALPKTCSILSAMANRSLTDISVLSGNKGLWMIDLEYCENILDYSPLLHLKGLSRAYLRGSNCPNKVIEKLREKGVYVI